MKAEEMIFFANDLVINQLAQENNKWLEFQKQIEYNGNFKKINNLYSMYIYLNDIMKGVGGVYFIEQQKRKPYNIYRNNPSKHLCGL